jgi:hypothetical protein
MSFEKKNLPLRRDFGEMLQAPKKDPDDPTEKPRYYIKVTAKEDILKLITLNTIIELEAPEEKFNRMLNSGKMTPEQVESIRKSMERIPKFFVKRLIAKIK